MEVGDTDSNTDVSVSRWVSIDSPTVTSIMPLSSSPTPPPPSPQLNSMYRDKQHHQPTTTGKEYKKRRSETQFSEQQSKRRVHSSSRSNPVISEEHSFRKASNYKDSFISSPPKNPNSHRHKNIKHNGRMSTAPKPALPAIGGGESMPINRGFFGSIGNYIQNMNRATIILLITMLTLLIVGVIFIWKWYKSWRETMKAAVTIHTPPLPATIPQVTETNDILEDSNHLSIYPPTMPPPKPINHTTTSCEIPTPNPLSAASSDNRSTSPFGMLNHIPFTHFRDGLAQRARSHKLAKSLYDTVLLPSVPASSCDTIHNTDIDTTKQLTTTTTTTPMDSTIVRSNNNNILVWKTVTLPHDTVIKAIQGFDSSIPQETLENKLVVDDSYTRSEYTPSLTPSVKTNGTLKLDTSRNVIATLDIESSNAVIADVDRLLGPPVEDDD